MLNPLALMSHFAFSSYFGISEQTYTKYIGWTLHDKVCIKSIFINILVLSIAQNTFIDLKLAQFFHSQFHKGSYSRHLPKYLISFSIILCQCLNFYYEPSLNN